jgi:hypothetical protein
MGRNCKIDVKWGSSRAYSMRACMDGWIDGWIDGCMVVWIDVRMDG